MSYYLVIAISLIIIISYAFNLLAKKTNIPSVLMLIVLGICIKQGMIMFNVGQDIDFLPMLELLGIVGLIMIVLEAALDLELNREKLPLIIRSAIIALGALVVSSLLIGLIIQFLVAGADDMTDFSISLSYAVPLSIMSSAIIIPSVGNLISHKKEFMIYESTFSDIFGIMFFYFLVGNQEASSATQVVFNVSGNIILTIVLSVVISYALVWVFQKVTTQVKLFLLIAVLLLLYSVGKLFHLSSLVIILIFGLIINNAHLFFVGKLQQFHDEKKLSAILHDFHLITIESAFVIRTFFFVIFGIYISLTSLVNLEVAIISVLIVSTLYLVRFGFLRPILGRDISPELWVAPRGLITILLFFNIPTEMQMAWFDPGILLYTILSTSFIMSFSLISHGGRVETMRELPDGTTPETPVPSFSEFSNEVHNMEGLYEVIIDDNNTSEKKDESQPEGPEDSTDEDIKL